MSVLFIEDNTTSFAFMKIASFNFCKLFAVLFKNKAEETSFNKLSLEINNALSFDFTRLFRFELTSKVFCENVSDSILPSLSNAA